MPSIALVVVFHPSFVLSQGVEGEHFGSLAHLHDRSQHRGHESVAFLKQTGPHRMEQIEHQTFDVRTVYVSICHDHNASVAKFVHVIVCFV